MEFASGKDVEKVSASPRSWRGTGERGPREQGAGEGAKRNKEDDFSFCLLLGIIQSKTLI